MEIAFLKRRILRISSKASRSLKASPWFGIGIGRVISWKLASRRPESF